MHKAIHVFAMIWGVILFLLGLASSMTMNDKDLLLSVIILLFVFMLVLPITILAIWKPSVSSLLLTVCFLMSQSAAMFKGGLCLQPRISASASRSRMFF